jgi:hypothetical protein
LFWHWFEFFAHEQEDHIYDVGLLLSRDLYEYPRLLVSYVLKLVQSAID